MTFGGLVVIAWVGRRPRIAAKTKWGNHEFLCVCDCGRFTRVAGRALEMGGSRSCGCGKSAATTAAKTTHGQSSTSEFRAWQSMRARCYRVSEGSFVRYGGRGIVVCEGWRNSSEKFLRDMGPKPSPKHSIDRRDNSGNYSCGSCEECRRNGWSMNCEWATAATQSRNRRQNVNIAWRGKTMCLVDWADELGIDRRVMFNRIALGWSIDRAFIQRPRKSPTKSKGGTHGL